MCMSSSVHQEYMYAEQQLDGTFLQEQKDGTFQLRLCVISAGGPHIPCGLMERIVLERLC
eukprot:m.43577 g.43577  ORF g.43577 m.43577 type:complete len:60 (-) comp12047_c0_seq4:558-737(-)